MEFNINFEILNIIIKEEEIKMFGLFCIYIGALHSTIR